MIVLSLDTTTRAGSAAIVRDGEVLGERTGDVVRTHGERLPADLMRLLEELHLDPTAIDLLAVAAGPGSFTGLRVGISAMQGLAMALDRRIVAVSALEALARAAVGDDRRIAPWMDAQRGEVFASLYDRDGTSLLVAPTSLPPLASLAMLEAYRGTPTRFVGDGALRYGQHIVESFGADAEIVATVPPLAGIIGVIAWRHSDRATAPHAVAPIYVRRPDAELARERRSGPT